jgi:hypothetical protein
MGETALRVVPYFQDWQIGLFVAAVGLLIVIAVLLKSVLVSLEATRGAIERGTSEIIHAIPVPPKVEKEITPTVAPEAPRDNEGYTAKERDILRIYGQRTLDEYRAQKNLIEGYPKI